MSVCVCLKRPTDDTEPEFFVWIYIKNRICGQSQELTDELLTHLQLEITNQI